MAISLCTSDTCTAFKISTVGTKVYSSALPDFMRILAKAVEDYDPTSDRVPGQHFVPLPSEANKMVSPGIGPRTKSPYDYVLATHRGRVGAFLKRRFTENVKLDGVACIVYTKAAYLADPQIGYAEGQRLHNSVYTHVVVAVLAFVGPRPPLTPHRFLANLAGGNKEAATYTLADIYKMAADVLEYDEHWCVVSD